MPEEYDRVVENALESGQNPAEVLAHKTMPHFEPPLVECEECGHVISLHEEKYGCDYEADRHEPDFGPVAWRCGCRAHVAESDKLQLALRRAYEATR